MILSTGWVDVHTAAEFGCGISVCVLCAWHISDPAAVVMTFSVLGLPVTGNLGNCLYCTAAAVSRCGSRLLAEAHCSALVVALRKAAGRSKRVHLFGRCLGLLEPVVPPAGMHCAGTLFV